MSCHFSHSLNVVFVLVETVFDGLFLTILILCVPTCLESVPLLLSASFNKPDVSFHRPSQVKVQTSTPNRRALVRFHQLNRLFFPGAVKDL